jgi:hypothetical protein
MWGREEHKALLLGVPKEFDHLTIYRSRICYFLDGRALLKNAYSVHLLQMKRRLLSARSDDGIGWRLAAAAVRRLRGSRKGAH